MSNVSAAPTPEDIAAKRDWILEQLRGRVPAHSVEDAAQDVQIAAIRSLPSFKPERPLNRWLYRIVVRTASRHRRALARFGLASKWFVEEKHHPTPEEDVMRAQRERAVHLALPAVPEVRRAVLDAHYVDEESATEIATRMKIPEGTAKNHLRLGRRDVESDLTRRGLHGAIALPFALWTLAFARVAQAAGTRPGGDGLVVAIRRWFGRAWELGTSTPAKAAGLLVAGGVLGGLLAHPRERASAERMHYGVVVVATPSVGNSADRDSNLPVMPMSIPSTPLKNARDDGGRRRAIVESGMRAIERGDGSDEKSAIGGVAGRGSAGGKLGKALAEEIAKSTGAGKSDPRAPRNNP